MDGAGIYLAPLLNLPPWGAYSDAKQVVQLINLLNARGANMVIYGMQGLGFFCTHACVFVGDINSQESCFEVFVGSSLSIIEIWGLSPLMLMNDACMTHFKLLALNSIDYFCKQSHVLASSG